MNVKAIIAIIPFFFLAFNYDDGELKTVYYNSLKFLKKSDAPQRINMIRSDHHSGLSTVANDGILFTYNNRGAKTVFMSGTYCGWKLKKMDRSDNGIWYYFLPAGESRSEIKYKFMVDNIWITDPENSDRTDDGMGSYFSIVEPVIKNDGTHVTYRTINDRTIEFRICRPKAGFISIVGDFNHWNPEHDLLVKGRDGIWRLRKKLFPGVYRYLYNIDGEWLPDIYNKRSGSDDTGEVCSIIEVIK